MELQYLYLSELSGRDVISINIDSQYKIKSMVKLQINTIK
jgi:hypothetical protein